MIANGAARRDALVHPPIESALYTGSVMHQRFRPLRHALRYRVFSLLLDLDELPALDRRLRLFSLNRFNLFSLHESDHGDGRGQLRSNVEQQLRAAGLPVGGAIRLLAMPRILGHVFNPLSVFFCHAADGRLAAILYEVSNTFGERHGYLIEVADDARRGAPGAVRHPGAVIEQRCAKRFHVSPFLALEMDYRFRVEPPSSGAAGLSVGVAAHDATGPVLNARFDARRQPLGDAALARAFVSHPLLTLKVVAAIHWEALKLFAKGLRTRPKPPPPPHAVTVVRARDA